MKLYRITVYTEGLSLNAMLNAKWQVRHRLSKQLKEKFKSEIKRQNLPKINEFTLHVEYSGRFDIDGTATTIKYFIDSMRDLGIIPDDTKQHFKAFSVEHSEERKKPSYEFTIKIHE